MKIYIIRHGETALNVQGRLQGWIDEPLNENGRKLAEVTGEGLKDIPFDLVISSPLIRARETGILAVRASGEQQGRDIPVLCDDRLKEINWGSWDGCGVTARNFSLPISKEEYDRLHTDTARFPSPPDGESVDDVIKRTADFFQELIRRPDYQDKTILIATHGLAMRALLNPLYEDPSDFWQGHVPYNCAVNILEVEKGTARFLKKDAIYYDPAFCFDPYFEGTGSEEEEKDKAKARAGEKTGAGPEKAAEEMNSIGPCEAGKYKAEIKVDERMEEGGTSPVKPLFVEYPKCGTCRKARKWLEEHDIAFDDRHIVENNPTVDEIKTWHEKSGLPLKRFFNTSGQVYRQNQIKDKLPGLSQEEQYALLAGNGMLVKRPLIVTEDYVLVGFKEKEYEEKLL